jgi:hypothetical protein
MSRTASGESIASDPGRAADDAFNGDRWLPSLTEKLNRPVSTWFCVVGWVVATGLFVALVAIFAGPSIVDIDESVYSTWAIQHGQIACAYPTVSEPGEPLVAPLYPLLSGGIAAIIQVGHGTPFPSAAAFRPGCRRIYPEMNGWFLRSGALTPTTWIGSVCWLALMAGVIAWLRACGRGRRGWEPATLLVVASLLPVWMCVQTVFHPQDLLALGLALSAMACARRDRWVLAGVLCALAVLSQQFALLVAIPLLVLAPSTRRVPFVGAGLLTGAVVIIPLTVLTSGRALRWIALGTGDNPSEGGTVFWETHAYGVAGVLLFRVAPIAVSLVLSWWVARRLRAGALDPVALMSLVAVSLGLRLVFEANLFSYYFMALAVSLVLLEVTRGAIRRTVFAWLVLLTLWICRLSFAPFGVVHWGGYLQNDVIPLLIGAAALLVILNRVLRGGDRRTLWPWVVVAAVDLFTLLPSKNGFTTGQIIWFWQVVLVVPGLLLAAQPLRAKIRDRGVDLVQC